MALEEPVVSESAKFRSSLEDTLTVLHKLANHTDSVRSVIAMIELAIVDDGQLRILIDKFSRPSMKAVH